MNTRTPADRQQRSPRTTLTADELQRYNSLVSALYGSLPSNDGFQAFFAAFQQHFKALQGGILGLGIQPRRMAFGWTFGYPEGFEEWFINSDLPEKDEALAHYIQLPPRQFDSLLKGDSSRDIADMLSPPTRAWVEQAGLGDSAGMLITRHNDTNLVFIANRHREHGPYTDSELLQMNLLAPHLANAVTLHIKLYQSHSHHQNLALALDQVKKPLIVFNAMASIVQANNTSHALLEQSDCLFINDHRQLCSSNPRITRKLRDAISTCIVHSHLGRLDTRILFINEPQGRIAVCLTPLVAETPAHNGVLAELFSYQGQLDMNLEKLQSLFQCTPAEAAVANDLAHGLSAAAIAEKNGVSVHTVRQHIKQLLAKNGYHKQAELIAMLVRALA